VGLGLYQKGSLRSLSRYAWDIPFKVADPRISRQPTEFGRNKPGLASARRDAPINHKHTKPCLIL